MCYVSPGREDYCAVGKASEKLMMFLTAIFLKHADTEENIFVYMLLNTITLKVVWR